MRYILLLVLAAASLVAADSTGKWSGTLTVSSPDGERAGPAYLVLKQDGTKLTGTAGPNAGEQHEIQNGKAENGSLTFELPVGSGLMKFSLKHDGDQIKGDISAQRDGETMTAKLAVKREN